MSLNGRIYTLTASRVLKANVFQINLAKFLLRAALKVRLGRETWAYPTNTLSATLGHCGLSAATRHN